MLTTKASITSVEKVAREANEKIEEEVKDLAKRVELAEAVYNIDDKIIGMFVFTILVTNL